MTLAIIQKFEGYWDEMEATFAPTVNAVELSFAASWTQLQALETAIATEAKSALVTTAPELETAVMPIVTSTIAALAAKLPSPALATFFTGAALNFVQDIFESWFPATASQTTIAVAATAANPTLTPTAPLASAAPSAPTTATA